MANDTTLTVVGNLTADPELRFTPSGVAVSNFTLASAPRHFDKQANQWQDGEPLFVRCTVWREQAENVAESLAKGARVIAQGRLEARSFEDKEGNRRTAWELQVDDVGPSLRFATASVNRQGRGGGQQSGGFGGGQQQSGGFGGSSDPWGQQSSGGWGGAPSTGGGWDTPGDQAPPF